jgi:vitamin B12 transporter
MKALSSRHALAIACTLAPCLAAAQTTTGAPADTTAATTSTTPAPAIAELNDIVVTGRRSPQPERDVLGDATVIDHQTLENAGQSSLGQVLSQQHGIEFYDNGGPQTATGISIRGANTDQTLVLLDGVPLNGATSGLAALNALPPDSIDHIEILRGSASSLYGADAIGGVINVITRKGSDKPFSAQASVGIGTYGTSKYSAGFSGSAGGWTYSLGASYGQSSGYNATNRDNAYAYNPDKDSYYSRNLNGSLGYEWKKGQTITFQAYNTRINGGIDYDRFNPYDDRSVQTLEMYSLASENQITDYWKSTLRYAYTLDKDLTRTATSDTTFSTRQDQYTWQNDLALGKHQKLTLAYEYLEQKASGQIPSYNADFTPGPMLNFNETRRHNNAFTGVYSGDFGRNHVQASLRNDDDSQFGSATTWGLSYGYDLTPHLRGYVAANTGFKTPTFNDLYYPGYANPDLEPEKSRNVEAGLKYTGDTYLLGIVVYRNKVRNLITFDPTANKPENLGQATLRGVTLTAEKDFGDTTLRASADFQDPHNDTDDKQLNRRARQIYRLSAEHHMGPWTLGGEYQFTGRRYDDIQNQVRLGGYGLVNLTAGYRIDRHLDVSVRWNNVLDKSYTTAYGYNMPGSNVFVNLRWTL